MRQFIHTWATPVFASAVALTSLLSGSAHAQSFELQFEAAPPSPAELVPMPLVQLVPVAQAPLPPEVAEQLREAFALAAAEAPDGDRFSVITQPVAGGVSFALAALTTPRSQNAQRTDALSAHLRSCLHSLSASSPPFSMINLLLNRGRLRSARDRADAAAASRQMLANWQLDGCATPLNQVTLNGTQLRAASSGMLTDDFGVSFAGQGLLELIETLEPLFYGPTGFWATEQAARLDALLASGLAQGLPDAATFQAATRLYPTFLSWVVGVHSLQGSIAPTFFTTVTRACIQSLEQLLSPFDPRDCVARGQLQFAELTVGELTYVAAARRAP